MKPLLKVCGIIEEATLEFIIGAELLIEQVGFVFAESRRRVETQQWKRLAKLVPNGTKSAGVFVNPSYEDVEAVFNAAPLDIVQLHGEETPEFCEGIKHRFSCALTKTVSIQNQVTDNPHRMIELNPYARHIDYLLLDTACGTQRGGTGKTFDWERIAPYREWSHMHGIPLLVAGGVHADNVLELLRQHEPDGVDISSGVETDGRKDVQKIRRMTERMSEYEQSTDK